MTKPLSPTKLLKNVKIPDKMILAANELLVENMGNSGRLTFTYMELKARYRMLVAGATSTEGERNNVKVKTQWLDIEDTFRQAGWHVKCDSPGFNESYDGYFIFEKPQGESTPKICDW